MNEQFAVLQFALPHSVTLACERSRANVTIFDIPLIFKCRRLPIPISHICVLFQSVSQLYTTIRYRYSDENGKRKKGIAMNTNPIRILVVRITNDANAKLVLRTHFA